MSEIQLASVGSASSVHRTMLLDFGRPGCSAEVIFGFGRRQAGGIGSRGRRLNKSRFGRRDLNVVRTNQHTSHAEKVDEEASRTVGSRLGEPRLRLGAAQRSRSVGPLELVLKKARRCPDIRSGDRRVGADPARRRTRSCTCPGPATASWSRGDSAARVTYSKDAETNRRRRSRRTTARLTPRASVHEHDA
jgi:hypothetical protein